MVAIIVTLPVGPEIRVILVEDLRLVRWEQELLGWRVARRIRRRTSQPLSGYIDDFERWLPAAGRSEMLYGGFNYGNTCRTSHRRNKGNRVHNRAKRRAEHERENRKKFAGD
jgi:hypothetical protein